MIDASKAFCLSKRRQPDWITQSTLSIIESKRKALVAGDLLRYRLLDKARKISVINDKNAYWSNIAQQVNDSGVAGSSQQMFAALRLLRQFGNRSNAKPVKDENGNLLENEADQLDRWRSYFASLLNANPVPIDPVIENLSMATLPDQQSITGPILADEVRDAIRSLKLKKAPGICGISAEMLRALPDSAIFWLTDFMNDVVEKQSLPPDWCRGLMVTIYKNKGDPHECPNYRGITLLSVAGKVYAKVLLTRAQPILRKFRCVEQAGFVPGRSTLDQIFALRLTIEKRREFNRPFIGIFVDLKKAFDSVDRKNLWNLLKVAGLPNNMIDAIKLLYSHTEAAVKLKPSAVSDWFQIRTGVKQGCVLAPELFNVAMDYVLHELKKHACCGIQIGDDVLHFLAYADDVVIFVENETCAELALLALSDIASRLGLQISYEKTEMVAFGQSPTPVPLSVMNKQIKYVDKFVYLGAIVQWNNDCALELNRRAALAKAASRNLYSPVWKRRNISDPIKVKVYLSLIRPILMYAAESWPMTKAMCKKLASTETQLLRRALGIKWNDFVPNDQVLSRAGIVDILTVLKNQRLRYYGHVIRTDTTYPCRRALMADPKAAGWKRPLGRPKTRWIDTMRHDVAELGISLENLTMAAYDREKFKRWIQA